MNSQFLFGTAQAALILDDGQFIGLRLPIVFGQEVQLDGTGVACGWRDLFGEAAFKIPIEPLAVQSANGATVLSYNKAVAVNFILAIMNVDGHITTSQ